VEFICVLKIYKKLSEKIRWGGVKEDEQFVELCKIRQSVKDM
jgi:hypothetical protein